jgi:hypothetical protein
MYTYKLHKKKIHASVELLSEDTNTSINSAPTSCICMTFNKKFHASVEFLSKDTNTTNLVHIINAALNECL